VKEEEDKTWMETQMAVTHCASRDALFTLWEASVAVQTAGSE